jgi:peptidoglycan/xylan/chitin deacetylase (PgdA/CDA1 family)
MNVQPLWLRRLRQSISPSVLALMYHRVAEVNVDPWDLCISPAHFEKQLQWLKKTNRVLSVNQLVDQLRTGKLTRRGLVLTFDDGYTDNFTVAKPLLEKYELPATFFLTTDSIFNRQPFWWDKLQFLIFDTHLLPSTLSVQIASENFLFDLGDESELTQSLVQIQKSWKATSPPPSKRCSLYLSIWKKMRPLLHNDQQQILAYLRNWANPDVKIRPEDSAISLAQLNELIDHPLIDIGAHSLSHPALSDHTEATQRHEIATSKNILEKISNRSITSFAYPYGDYDRRTQKIVNEEGFSIAFTTKAVLTSARSNQYQIGRFPVPNCTGEQLQKQLDQIL